MTRPAKLPEYETPPVNEVVLGLQFAPAPGFSSAAHDGVFRLFHEEFPKLEEHPPLEPRYETFGGSNPQPSFQFNIGGRPIGSRLWFVSKDATHLLQFQRDRFLTNWRRRPVAPEYPRFDGIAEAFRANVEKLDGYLKTEFNHSLAIDQTEVSYMNLIPLDAPTEVGQWLHALNLDTLDIESFQASFAEIISDHDGQAMGRLSYEIQHGIVQDGKKHALQLTLSARGRPATQSVDAAFEFMTTCRNKIVARFDQITTERAHSNWKRVR